MSMVSKHFHRAEFKCNCGKCDQDTIDAQLVRVLERLRVWANAPITVNSGNRCPAYNKSEGGSPNSQHLLSRAADIVVAGKTPKEVYDRINTWYPDALGLGSYDSFTHVDTRTEKARW
jgi:uncharacterized protein YcbK (DUF882 family)